ncbi:MFS transporter [Rugamonas aquatica]|uniref:DHA2 family efflux MFS transporter permease subunit n=1 Tax=Rugamonas aquatica TaxID=2743357 RepID=A0A6A7MYD9_9BURK|nr:MFS transporter [Rugamonas aquatica]MQA37731.1 DHA2 family efflux MFS transporter permease subunit [Rugamonas aquatica]
MHPHQKPWPVFWTLVIGTFMVLIDATIVSVANPAIMAGLDTSIGAVMWVTSAYLLAYAAPLLLTGRLGDRYGPKPIYLTGLAVFALASLACGLSQTAGQLIAARVVQGIGAACMVPQTMAVITRIFPAAQRGQAMGLLGAVAGISTLIGPMLGGAIVNTLGWQWIFFVNVPVGLTAFVLARKLLPEFGQQPHRLDIPGAILSGAGLLLIALGIQDGERYHWGVIAWQIPVWALIVGGVLLFALFLLWQRGNKHEPLLPLELFRDRNFTVGNLAISIVGFTTAGMLLPLIFYFQIVMQLSPLACALMLAPMALVLAALAPFTGKLADRIDPRYMACFGLACLAGGLLWYALWLPDAAQSRWLLLLPSALLGVANACIWAPISASTMRNLPPARAGAGSGIFNTTRQIGSVLGAASIAALVQAQLARQLPADQYAAGAFHPGALDPANLALFHAGFARAMAHTMLLPAAAALLGACVVLFFAKNRTA